MSQNEPTAIAADSAGVETVESINRERQTDALEDLQRSVRRLSLRMH